MSSSDATDPARFVGPCITLASSWTMPSALGSPPSPTDWSSGSSSWMFAAAIAASSGSAPATSRSYATLTPRKALSLAITAGRPAVERARSSSARSTTRTNAGSLLCGSTSPPRRRHRC